MSEEILVGPPPRVEIPLLLPRAEETGVPARSPDVHMPIRKHLALLGTTVRGPDFPFGQDADGSRLLALGTATSFLRRSR